MNRLYADIQRDAGGVGSEHIQKRYLMTEDDYRAMLYLARHLRFESNEPMLRERIRTLGEDGVVLGRLDRSPFQKCLIELANPETMLMDVMDASKNLLPRRTRRANCCWPILTADSGRCVRTSFEQASMGSNRFPCRR